MNDYEAQRLENLKHKQQLLADLNLSTQHRSKRVKPESRKPKERQKPMLENRPSRASARIASSQSKPAYSEHGGERHNYVSRKAKQSPSQRVKVEATVQEGQRSLVPPSPDAAAIRAGWTQWTSTGPAPSRDDDDGTFHFADYPSFTPNKSPAEVIREGSFGGSYWRPLQSRRLGIVVEDDWRELPAEWYAGVEVERYLTSPRYDASRNKFGVACGQSIEQWEEAGWIAWQHDVRGWFQWYCRFFQGRRCADDERQVSRWRKCVGETGRWRRMLLKKYRQMGVREVFDDGEEEGVNVSPVMHQTCAHWAFEVRQGVLDAFWKSEP